jgi:hypothetical protein
MNATNTFIYLNKISRILFFLKNRVLQTYPLKMNLALEIQMDWEKNLETTPSNLLLSHMSLLPRCGDSIAP